jgi:hypothetical protein
MIRLILELLRPTAVTREMLGTLGGNPHFVPPHRDIASDMQQGMATPGKYTSVDPGPACTSR